MSREGELAGVKEGDVLAGKYRVDKVLGIGGMGVVVAAHHLQLDDRVAIKFLLPETLGNKEAVGRFAREARAAVKIKSEHVARVTDVGTLESGAPYMVMEYLEGSDLAAWVSQRGALPVEQAVEFVLQACEAIAEAHALGIVHRDLKPANLFVAKLPGGAQSVKVLDFGISKLTGLSASGNQSSATKTSSLMGSPLYMSPEQMQSSKDVDARGDIWALGVILYELITGVSPFIADTMPELILKIMQSPPPPMSAQRPDAPGGLEAVILRCLEKDRGRRYQTVGELGPALLPFAPKRARGSVDRISQVMQAAGMSASALALPPSSEGAMPLLAGTAAGTAASFAASRNEPEGGKRRSLAFGGLVVAALIAVGALVVVRSTKPAAAPLPTEAPASAAQSPARTEPVALPVAPPPVATPTEREVHAPEPAPSALPLKGAPPPIQAHGSRPPKVLTVAPVVAHASPALSPPAVGPAPQLKQNAAPATTTPSILGGGRM